MYKCRAVLPSVFMKKKKITLSLFPISVGLDNKNSFDVK